MVNIFSKTFSQIYFQDESVYDYGDYDYNPGDFTVNPLIALLGLNSSVTPKPSVAHGNLSTSDHHASGHNATNLDSQSGKPGANDSLPLTGTPNKTQVVATPVPKTHHHSPIILATLADPPRLTPVHQKLFKGHNVHVGGPSTSPIRIIVKPGLRKLYRKKKKPGKKVPPFRLRAVYRPRAPQRVHVLPRKVMSEFVIEAPSNDRGGDDEDDDLEDDEELDVDNHQIEAIEGEDDDEDDDEGSVDGNTNKKPKKKQRKKKRRKNKNKVPYEFYEGEYEYEPEPYLPSGYRPEPVLEYVGDHEAEDDTDFLGIGQSSL